MKCVAYLRVSGKSQTDGDGPRRQEETIREFCAKHKIELKAIFSETISGTVEGLSRPVFCEMLEAIENFRRNGEEIAGVVAERADRFARDLLVAEILLLECRKRKVAVYAADRELADLSENDGDPTRKLLRQVTSAIAEWEKNNIVLKLRKAREAIAAKTGKPCGGGIPYGSNAQEKVVLQTLRVFVQPDHTLKQVADLLNREGLKTRRGFSWTEQSAQKVMRVAGVWTRKDPSKYRLRNFGNARMVGSVNVGQLNQSV